jgi:hypothetical protein
VLAAVASHVPARRRYRRRLPADGLELRRRGPSIRLCGPPAQSHRVPPAARRVALRVGATGTQLTCHRRGHSAHQSHRQPEVGTAQAPGSSVGRCRRYTCTTDGSHRPAVGGSRTQQAGPGPRSQSAPTPPGADHARSPATRCRRPPSHPLAGLPQMMGRRHPRKVVLTRGNGRERSNESCYYASL